MSELNIGKDYLDEMKITKSSKMNRVVIYISTISLFVVLSISIVSLLMLNNRIDKLENSLIVMDHNGNIGSGHLSRVDEREVARLQFESTLILGVSSLYSYTDETFNTNMDLALPLFDETGRFVYESYISDRIHNYIAANNIEVEAIVDSVNVLTGYVEFHQEWTKNDDVKRIDFIGTFGMERAPVTENNRYGARIVNWKRMDKLSEDGI